MKICSKCKTDKELSEYNKLSRSKDNLQRYCRACQKVKNTAWTNENRDQKYVINAKWSKANPDVVAANMGKQDAVHRGAKLPTNFNIHATTAFYAESRRLTRDTDTIYEVDHIIPIDKGGLHCPTNLQVLTKEANMAKSNHISGEITI